MEPVPSIAMVNDTCIAACKSMKGLSKQLMLLNVSYQKSEFPASGSVINESLLDILKSIQNIQNSLLNVGKSMNNEFDEHKYDSFPESFVITSKEYMFLNKVFEEYTSMLTSKPFSLFSSQLVQEEVIGPCPDNDKKSKIN